MRQLIIFLLTSFSIASYSQDLAVYKDTINNFSIGIPVGWRYGIPKNFPSIKMFAQQTQSNSSKLFVNYNLNIYNSSHSTPERAYEEFITSISEAKNFKIIDSSNAVINGINYNWIIETHENSQAPITMCDYVFMTFKNDTSYILT